MGASPQGGEYVYPRAGGPGTLLLPRPIGIFGLSHNELMQSRWVQKDVLHVKVELAERTGCVSDA